MPTGKEALAAVEYLGGFLLGNKGIEERVEGDGKDEVEFRKWRTEVGMQRIVKDQEGDEVEDGDEEVEDGKWELRRRR